MAARRAIILVCDNPACPVEAETGGASDLPNGIHLGAGAYQDRTAGCRLPKIFVCSKPCLVPAIEALVEAAWS